MRARTVTVSAVLLLALCVAAWARSYLPEHSTVRAHRGALYVIYYDQQRAYAIDPANHPSQSQGLVSRWGTEQILYWARRAGGDAVPGARRAAAAGFEFVTGPLGCGLGVPDHRTGLGTFTVSALR